MSHVEQLIAGLQNRADVSVESQRDAWLIRVPGGEFVCEITVPVSVHEWFAAVRRSDDGAEVWSDWMDHYDASEAELDAERASDISAFVERLFTHGIQPPLSIYAKA